jgi:tripartite ATP-independent transporter DctM subunit
VIAQATESTPHGLPVPDTAQANQPVSLADRLVLGAIAILVAALCAVVGLQVVGRHLFHEPFPWTEEVARVILVWVMCVGGVSALSHGEHPRVTALVRRLRPDRRAAVDRGLRIVLIGFFVALIAPAWRLTVASAAELLPASGLSGAAISAVLPVALILMTIVLLNELRRDGLRVWLDAAAARWSAGAALLTLASVGIPILAGAPPLLVLVLGFLTTAALGVPLAFTLALTSLTYLIGIGGVGLIILPIKILGGVDSFVLLAIPLFVLGGALMESAGISERIVDLAMAIVGRVRGGLAMVVVVAEIIFSGISGSTAADVSAISSLLVPSMRKAGYSGPESVSVVAAASAMGILVPPCLTMVVLGSLVNLSIVTLFLAGFIPALLLAGVLLVLIAIRARRQNWPVAARATRSDLGRASRRAIVPLGLPVLLFGGIFSGLTTVTEAALLAVVYALVVEFALGGIDGRGLVHRLAQSGVVTATTLWVLAAASAFAWILVREWVPQALGEWITAIGAGQVGFFALTIAVFVVIGALLEGLPALLIFGPILFPISRAVGVDPVHYGIVIVAAMGIAFFLPPVGVGLTIAAGIARVDIDEVSRTYVPYLIALLVGLALIAAFPWFTLVLPRLFLGYAG